MGAKAIVSQVSPLRPGLCPTHPPPAPRANHPPHPRICRCLSEGAGGFSPTNEPSERKGFSPGHLLLPLPVLSLPLTLTLVFSVKPLDPPKSPNQLHTNHLKLKNSWHSSYAQRVSLNHGEICAQQSIPGKSGLQAPNQKSSRAHLSCFEDFSRNQFV